MFFSRFLYLAWLLCLATAFSAAPASAQATLFLLIDEDSIDNGALPNVLSTADVNDDIAAIGVRAQLRFFKNNVGRTIELYTGQTGDEGWFALKTIPSSWVAAGGLQPGFVGNPAAQPGDAPPHGVGPGLGAAHSTGDRESLLDRVPDVTPLRGTAIEMLRGREVCALVYDSEISINYSPLTGNLKGATLGLVAFRVMGNSQIPGASPSTLPKVEVTILDAAQVCAMPLSLFMEAPTPLSSSEPVSVPENAVVNGASFAPAGTIGQAPAPGSIVSIFGANLTSETLQARAIPLPISLGGVTVTFRGVPAALLFVSPRQINAQLPWGALPSDAGSGTADIIVNREGISSPSRTVQLGRFSPAIFTFQSGIGPAAAVNPNGALAQPEGAVPGIASEPARPGNVLMIFATGLGVVDAPPPDGQNSMDRLRHTATVPTVLIGNHEARVLFSGLSPQFVGVYQLNVEVPSSVPAGNAVPLQIRIGGVTTSDRVTIAVR